EMTAGIQFCNLPLLVAGEGVVQVLPAVTAQVACPGMEVQVRLAPFPAQRLFMLVEVVVSLS
ncbi:hypothetical protein RYZ18_13940, partial [Roseovarius sp. 10]